MSATERLYQLVLESVSFKIIRDEFLGGQSLNNLPLNRRGQLSKLVKIKAKEMKSVRQWLVCRHISVPTVVTSKDVDSIFALKRDVIKQQAQSLARSSPTNSKRQRSSFQTETKSPQILKVTKTDTNAFDTFHSSKSSHLVLQDSSGAFPILQRLQTPNHSVLLQPRSDSQNRRIIKLKQRRKHYNNQNTTATAITRSHLSVSTHVSNNLLSQMSSKNELIQELPSPPLLSQPMQSPTRKNMIKEFGKLARKKANSRSFAATFKI